MTEHNMTKLRGSVLAVFVVVMRHFSQIVDSDGCVNKSSRLFGASGAKIISELCADPRPSIGSASSA